MNFTFIVHQCAGEARSHTAHVKRSGPSGSREISRSEFVQQTRVCPPHNPALRHSQWQPDAAHRSAMSQQQQQLPWCMPGSESTWLESTCRLDPLVVSTCGLLGLLLVLYFAARILAYIVRATWTNTEFVGAARAAQRELRSRLADHYPPVGHVLSKDMQGNSGPVACSVCLVPVTSGGDGLFCMICGTVVHHSCRRLLKKTCKPLCLPPDKPPYHDWRPAGSTLVLDTAGQDAGAAGASEDEAGDTEAQCCIYCNEPCEVGLISLEPVWVCSCCHCLAHVQCFMVRHPTLFSGSTRAKLQAQLQGLDARPVHGLDRHHNIHACNGGSAGSRGSWFGSSRASVDGSSGCKSPPQQEKGAHSSHDGADPGAPHTAVLGQGGADGAQGGEGAGLRRRTSRRLAGKAGGTGGTAADAAAAAHHHAAVTQAGSSGAQDGASDGGAANGSDGAGMARQAGSGRPRGSDDGHMELCGLGACARCYLPPTSVITTEPTATRRAAAPEEATASHRSAGSDVMAEIGALAHRAAAAAAAARRKFHQKGGRSAAAVAGPGSPGHAANGGSHAVVGPGVVAGPPRDSTGGKVGKGGGGGAAQGAGDMRKVSSSSSVKKGWWHRAESNRWSSFKLREEVPPGCKPILVFINLKSGPQLGRTSLLQLLQLLHPLQVVELPREDPIHALRFFAPWSPHVRVLVMGGDGTVGWVLQTLDKVALEQPAGWAPAPVAIMPMGTGNDLARCLGWGAGVRLQGGLSGYLLEVASSSAHPVPLDRWTVSFSHPARPMPESSSGSQGTLQRILSNTRHSVAAAAAAAAAAVQSAATTKTLTNYIGIGIDAKVALQFHQARSAFPFWFQSQLGNKVWYTGLGAPDLVRRSCVDLSKKLTLECDGVIVPVPSDAQGLVIINIPCHMGGVYLWENGLPAPSVPLPEDAAPEMVDTAEKLTRNRRMGVADGLIEVVAIGGVAHMGRLAVGLARAQRLAQCSQVTVTTQRALPMQVDGEPWMQDPCVVTVTLKSQAMMLRRVGGGPAQRVVAAVTEALDDSQAQGVITAAQKHAIAREVGRRLEAVL